MHIENIKNSIVKNNVRFIDFSIKELSILRRLNIKITNMMWITKETIVTEQEVYNPKTPILIWLN